MYRAYKDMLTEMIVASGITVENNLRQSGFLIVKLHICSWFTKEMVYEKTYHNNTSE
jgi:hypothetical protein